MGYVQVGAMFLNCVYYYIMFNYDTQFKKARQNSESMEAVAGLDPDELVPADTTSLRTPAPVGWQFRAQEWLKMQL